LFFTYILENAEGKFYIGFTDDPGRRLTEHNDIRGVTFTHKHGPWSIVWQEAFETRAEAMAREKQIKRMKSAKWIRENLLNGRVPTSRD
jgi:putative endonuclease